MNDKELSEKIIEGINKIDSGSVDTPDIMYFNNLVKERQALQAKRQNIQFIAFIGFAMVFVPFIISTFLRNLTVFIILQAVTLITASLWYIGSKLIELRRRKLKYE